LCEKYNLHLVGALLRFSKCEKPRKVHGACVLHQWECSLLRGLRAATATSPSTEVWIIERLMATAQNLAAGALAMTLQGKTRGEWRCFEPLFCHDHQHKCLVVQPQDRPPEAIHAEQPAAQRAQHTFHTASDSKSQRGIHWLDITTARGVQRCAATSSKTEYNPPTGSSERRVLKHGTLPAAGGASGDGSVTNLASSRSSQQSCQCSQPGEVLT
jgi:hypothetical protein